MSLHPHISDAQYVTELEAAIAVLVDRLPSEDRDLGWMPLRVHLPTVDALLYGRERGHGGQIQNLETP